MTGDACWDDTAAPGGPRGRFNRLVGLSEGFKSIDVGRNQPIQIMCVPCNADVPIPPAPEKS